MGQETHSCLGTSLSCGLIECVRISCTHIATQQYKYLVITLEKCVTILNKGKDKYNNEEVKLIRQYLYLLAELQIENEKIIKTKKQEL